MKTKLFLLTIAFFPCLQLFAQVKTFEPLTQKKVVPITTTVQKMPATAPKKNVPPQAPPTDLQNAVVNIVVGDDGKDKDTYVAIGILDDNKRTAAYYGTADMGTNIQPMDPGEYFPGDNETLPTKLDKSEPTGQMDNSRFPILPVLREATLSDFTNGGIITIIIQPTGHDTWKINSFTVTLYFNNDGGSPHKMTWNGFTLSQDSYSRILEFDKNFNPIQ